MNAPANLCLKCALMEITGEPHDSLNDLLPETADRSSRRFGILLRCEQCRTLWKKKWWNSSGNMAAPSAAAPSAAASSAAVQ